ncbi:putative zinc finger CCCH domain-containing protein 20 [Abeliophyllum distichum]|uniref:Zinc finger CCCH domain-containing protein 20 n=1 Tax=Abeliophyllum distichum TaxID=126358 RepID=A0ABD1VDG9_9LAMI
MDGERIKCRFCTIIVKIEPDQLRVVSPSTELYDGSSHRLAFMFSPESGSLSVGSPLMSPITSATTTSLNNVKSIHSSWNMQVGCSSSRLGSARLLMTQSRYFRLPSTLSKPVTQAGFEYVDDWKKDVGYEEEPPMERVE